VYSSTFEARRRAFFKRAPQSGGKRSGLDRMREFGGSREPHISPRANRGGAPIGRERDDESG
jgi:hypothetical protein